MKADSARRSMWYTNLHSLLFVKRVPGACWTLPIPPQKPKLCSYFWINILINAQYALSPTHWSTKIDHFRGRVGGKAPERYKLQETIEPAKQEQGWHVSADCCLLFFAAAWW